MNYNCDISIVIVNYNVKDFLSQCVNSIFKSDTSLEYEIIVIDNCSTDGSKEIFTELADQEDRLQYHYQHNNLGFGKANNLGFKIAKGKYTLILNPDTLLEPDTLEVMYNYMEQNQDIGASGCKVLNPDKSFQSACRRGFPTPWASFCKLFGLQKLFPKSKLFAKYNLSYLNEEETNDIDALIGAFMFVRSDVLSNVSGFDEEFFMYGEDLDLCFRIKQSGYRVSYYPKTTIIHFKGESAKRSTINETKHFYEAMEIFARKHYGKSKLFLSFLKLGIKFRSLFAYLKNNKSDVAFIIIDLLIINLSLLVSTQLRRGDMFAFPDYAYPTVFIYLSVITFFSMIFSGEYFEQKHSIRKSFFGLLTSFLILTFLTYFFRDFAFSRGILLMTITFSVVLTTIVRVVNNVREKRKNLRNTNKIVIVGWTESTETLVDKIKSNDPNSEIIGYINNEAVGKKDIPYLGEPEYIQKTINDRSISEVIVVDEDQFKFNQGTKYMRLKNNDLVRVYFSDDYNSLMSSKIVTNLSGTTPEGKISKLNLLRYRIFKRVIDIVIAVAGLTIGLPFTLIKGKSDKFVDLLLGKVTFIGKYPNSYSLSANNKIGIIGLVHISEPEKLNEKIINELNDYYFYNYTMSLDVDILFKYIFRR